MFLPVPGTASTAAGHIAPTAFGFQIWLDVVSANSDGKALVKLHPIKAI